MRVVKIILEKPEKRNTVPTQSLGRQLVRLKAFGQLGITGLNPKSPTTLKHG